ncbi:hypothetical protein [Spirillospora sp. NPDC048823]|uniref:hypothetical protein n=1 Tax=unclassified Spirillospora TaxID=2642701 RepID=UPI003719ECA0
MDLRARLFRFAAARPRPFVITAPGGTRTRLLVEAELRRRGGRPATAPAVAMILIVCGHPGAELAAAVNTIWDDMPGPRSLVRLGEAASGDEVAAALEHADRALADVAAQRADATARQESGPWAPGGHENAEAAERHGDHPAGHEDDDTASSESDGSDDHGSMLHEHGDEQDEDAEEEGHHGHEQDNGHADHADHGDHREDSPDGEDEHSGHSGHGGGGHEHHRGAPMDLPMAERGEDRDGLKLDVLHVPLGPALQDWPAGLVIHLTLQGDVVQVAEVAAVEETAGGSSFWDEPWLRAASGEQVSTGEAERRRAACHLDSVGRLLAVAGWESAADQARALRDQVLAGVAEDELAPRFARFARRTGRSRTLRWMLGRVGVIDRAMADRHGLSGPAARDLGDASARLTGWLDEIGRALARVDDPAPLDGADGPRETMGRWPSATVLALLPELLEGADLSEARLTVASLDPDLSQLAGVAGVAGE